MISAQDLEKKINHGIHIWALTCKLVPKDFQNKYPQEIGAILEEFKDIFPEDLPKQLPPMRDIQHLIDLVLESTLLNLSYYRLNPSKDAELQRQVRELLDRGFIRESLSPYTVSALLILKKDGL